MSLVASIHIGDKMDSIPSRILQLLRLGMLVLYINTGCQLLQYLLGFPLVCTCGLAATVYFTITGTEYNVPVCFYFSLTLTGGLTGISYPARKGTYWFKGLCWCRRHQSDERRLYDDIMKNYDGMSRPVLNGSSILQVNFSITLHKIMDLDEKNQTLITHVWIYEEWTDEVLQWNPADYGGLEFLVLPTEELWVPDLYIFNNADKGQEGFVVANGSRVLVRNDGHTHMIVPLIIKSSCAVNVAYFPFDAQTCFVRFGSWIYDATQLNILLKQTTVDMSTFSNNSELELAHQVLIRQINTYELSFGGMALYPQVLLHLFIRRKPLYYAYTVIAPTLVLCILMLFSFWLPCDHGGKVGINLTVFLSLYVLQLAIAENMPESNSLPLIGLFLTMVMALNAISLLVATLIINLKRKGERKPCPEVPRLLFKICELMLAKVTFTTLLSYEEVYGKCGSNKGAGYDNRAATMDEEVNRIAGEIYETAVNARKFQYSPVPGCSNFTDGKTGKNEQRKFALRDMELTSPEPGCSFQDTEFHVDHDGSPAATEAPGEIASKRSDDELSRDDTSVDSKSETTRLCVRQSPLKLRRRRTTFRKSKKRPNIRWLSEYQTNKRFEWYFVAETLDKMLFMIYITCMGLSVAIMLIFFPALQGQSPDARKHNYTL